ncbi:KH domain-containing protein [Candidatus Gottesmanbacteria bacterium]|nr:KH domain-containing protein [Candidatus Gottesmanbacteria bacterium]
MKSTLHFLVTSIVDHADDVVIDEQTDAERTVLTIHVNPEDMGKIIGKSGRIIRALRDLIKLIAAKHSVYADVEVAESEPTA